MFALANLRREIGIRVALGRGAFFFLLWLLTHLHPRHVDAQKNILVGRRTKEIVANHNNSQGQGASRDPHGTRTVKAVHIGIGSLCSGGATQQDQIYSYGAV
jgi:hypothetical protein